MPRSKNPLWKWKYWIWNAATLPLWVLALLTAIYAFFTHQQWQTQKAANENASIQFRQTQDSTYKHFREDQDSIYLHFRETQDTETDHFFAALKSQLLQFQTQQKDLTTLNDAEIVIIDPEFTDSSLTAIFENSGKTSAWIISTEYRFSIDSMGLYDKTNWTQPENSPIGGGNYERKKVSLPIKPLSNLKPTSYNQYIRIAVHYTNAFGNEFTEEALLYYISSEGGFQRKWENKMKGNIFK